MIKKKIAKIKIKRKKILVDANNLIKDLKPVIEKAIKIYIEHKYGIKL